MSDAKKIKNEQQLYGLFLDLWYADQGYTARIDEMKEELKDMQTTCKKVKKQLSVVEAQYSSLYNSKPSPPKR